MATIDDASKLVVSFASSRKIMLPARKGDELDLHFNISSSDIPVNKPISMCFVIDISGSMEDEMLVLKDSLRALLTEFRDFDKLSIVTFSDDSEVELELTTMNEDGKPRANDVISSLEVTGLTNIEAGLSSGIDIYSKVSVIFI